MRNLAILLTATVLAACSGGGAQSVGSAGSVSTGSGSGTGTTPTSDAFAQFAKPTVTATYSGVGGSQVYTFVTDQRFCCGQQAQVFAANTSTVRSSGASITYDPSNAVFTLTVTDPLTGASTNTRFQDPASRTNFGGAVEPQWGVPNLPNANIRYLQAGDGDPLSPYSRSGSGLIYDGTNDYPVDGNSGTSYQSTDFFYEVPGADPQGTQYVTLAGYLRNAISWADLTLADGSNVKQATWHLERGAFAYGAQTDQASVPNTGSGTYTGSMLATMVVNPTIDGTYGSVLPTYFQWITGTSTTTVNFATSAVTLALSGTVTAPQIESTRYDGNGVPLPGGVVPYSTPARSTIAAGATFSASGTATIDLVKTGGFTGQIQTAGFSATTNGAPTGINIAGSTINGAFFGPKAEEVGGGFHIVGGTPDQRIDILGAFKGKH